MSIPFVLSVKPKLFVDDGVSRGVETKQPTSRTWFTLSFTFACITKAVQLPEFSRADDYSLNKR